MTTKKLRKHYDVFLICPVRFATPEQKKKMEDYIFKLEMDGKYVYYPARDTEQDKDPIGYDICLTNAKAIKNSREIHIWWDKNSSGSKFDLGVAFALDCFMKTKPLVIANPEDLDAVEGKSFENMLAFWSMLDVG